MLRAKDGPVKHHISNKGTVLYGTVLCLVVECGDKIVLYNILKIE